MKSFLSIPILFLAVANSANPANAHDCSTSALLRAYENTLRQPPKQTFDAEHRAGVNGGKLWIRKLDKSTLIERIDYGERGEHAKRILVFGISVLFEESMTTYFYVNDIPDARLTQTRVVNRVMTCNSRLVESGPLAGGGIMGSDTINSKAMPHYP
jgi:hypothetical protein